MSDSPGWASPGSSPSGPPSPSGGGSSDGDTAGRPADPSDSTPTGGPDTTHKTSLDKEPSEQVPPNWSSQQPPAAPQGWGAPPPPPPGRPGWGHWNQPPAAKPGVIPLRPLGVGEILDGAVSTARAHWRTALGISLAVAVMIHLASTIATGVWLRDNSGFQALQTKAEPTLEDLQQALSGTLNALAVEQLALLVGTVIATAMLTVVVGRAVLGHPVSIKEAWRESRPQLLRMLGLTLVILLLMCLAIIVGVLPGVLLAATGPIAGGIALTLLGGLAGTVVAVWLWVRYCLSAPALMLERQGVFTSLRRSAKLVRGSWWRIFGIQLLTFFLVFIVGTIIQFPASLLAPVVSGQGLGDFLSTGIVDISWTYLAVVGIGGVVASTITLPLSAGVTALLYMDQRIRREALDLELARAAGVPGYEQHSGDTASPGS